MANLTDPKVHMGTITGGEGRELYAANPVVLLPMGSHEDQGPHAPMGDYLLAEKVAELAALRATELGTRTVVAPVLPFGGADHFGPMIGGIAIGQGTLELVIGDMLDSLFRNGLTRIIVINGHGGNVGPIAEVTREVYRRDGVLIPSLYLWRIGYGLLPGIVGPDKARAVSGHGADPLTSIGLHLFPELIRKDLVPEGRALKPNAQLGIPHTALGLGAFEGAEVGLPVEYDEIYNDGVAGGDPRLCSAETGAALVEKLTDLCARFIRHYDERVPA
ncbi:creatininase family protein [Teichococcus oryzae]|uniref:Creatininase family protein n=1 Tax=Teichococcus oryzae TaxID=1608942 RepID=A0A5B2TCD7_9PROT|nr:creatininase family protein [Pseudoroseomonas oryzae]KAA2211829.1 creatininase family protein [Pseudoroseomonas oryzae]